MRAGSCFYVGMRSVAQLVLIAMVLAAGAATADAQKTAGGMAQNIMSPF